MDSTVDDKPIEDKELGVDGIEELLGDESEPESKVDEPDDKEEEKDDDKEDEGDEEEEVEIEDKEDDEEEEEPDEDELELITPVRRQEILKEFPDLFKKFPYIEKAYFRDQKFTELFATIQDAEETKERAEALDSFESQLLQGNTEPVLKAIKDEDPEAFKSVVDNYLQTLAKVDSDAYFHTVGNVIKRTVMSMAQEAQRTNNEKLNESALLLNQFIFGSSNFEAPTNLATKTDNKEADKLKQERQTFEKERFDTALGDLSGKIENRLKATISEHIDPRGAMTDYVKRHATADALAQLEESISGDDRFSKIIDRLWEQAKDSNYSQASLNRIRSTYISKAKTLLPSAIKSARSVALKGMGQRKEKSSGSNNESSRTRRSSSSSTRPPGSDGRGMRTVDFFNQD